MATQSFMVHTEKENDISIRKPFDKSMKGMQAFPNKNGKLSVNPTPRKALGSVNQLQPAPQTFKGKGLELSQGPVEALFKSKKVIKDENSQNAFLTKKPKVKKSPAVPVGLRKSVSCKPVSKSKTPKIKPKPIDEPIPVIPADVDYDSDTIFPRKERLSCYVEKLLMWRPPCPFSTLPETDSDSDVGNFNDSIDDIVLDQIPGSVFDLDDQDIPKDSSEWLTISPVLSPSSFPSPPPVDDFDPLNSLTPDTSLHLGSLQFGSPESFE